MTIVDCDKCGTDKDDRAECDSCDGTFCLNCVNTRKTDITARKGSKCLRMYCNDCRENKVDRLKISGLLYKLDLFNQQQKEIQAKNDDTMISFARQLKALYSKVNALEIPI